MHGMRFMPMWQPYRKIAEYCLHAWLHYRSLADITGKKLSKAPLSRHSKLNLLSYCRISERGRQPCGRGRPTASRDSMRMAHTNQDVISISRPCIIRTIKSFPRLMITNPEHSNRLTYHRVLKTMARKEGITKSSLPAFQRDLQQTIAGIADPTHLEKREGSLAV